MKKIPRIIQLTAEENGLYALTETGQVFSMDVVDGWVEIQTEWITSEEASKRRIELSRKMKEQTNE